jgi:hypothetical protein
MSPVFRRDVLGLAAGAVLVAGRTATAQDGPPQEGKSDKSRESGIGDRASSSKGGSVLTRITPEDLIAILEEEGYPGATLVEEQGVPLVTIVVAGNTIIYALKPGGQDLSAAFGVKDSNATLRRINDWNRLTRYTRASLDENDAAILQLELDLSKGVTRATVVEYVTFFLSTINPFIRLVSE